MNRYIHNPPLPPSPPPNYEPENTCLEAHPKFLKNCLHTYIFIWLTDGRSYWFYPTGFDKDMLSGYVWNRPGWAHVQFEWRQIECFY